MEAIKLSILTNLAVWIHVLYFSDYNAQKWPYENQVWKQARYYNTLKTTKLMNDNEHYFCLKLNQHPELSVEQEFYWLKHRELDLESGTLNLEFY